MALPAVAGRTVPGLPAWADVWTNGPPGLDDAMDQADFDNRRSGPDAGLVTDGLASSS